MPTYTYTCPRCGDFEAYASLSDYKPRIRCPNYYLQHDTPFDLLDKGVYSDVVEKKCKRMCNRNLMADTITVSGLCDDGPSTLGALADKNSDRMSVDEKESLDRKHNEYKKVDPNKELPPGMSRVGKNTLYKKVPKRPKGRI